MKQDLINVSTLATQFKTSNATALATLQKANLVPAQEFSMNGRTFRLYDATAAMKVMADAKVAKAQPPAPAAAPEVDGLLALRSQVDSLGASIVDIDDACSVMRSGVARLGEQNATMFRTIQVMQRELRDGLAAVNALVKLVGATPSPSAPAAAPSSAPVEVPPPAPEAVASVELDVPVARKRRVVIVGLTDAQFAQIAKEFGGVFDLRHVVADQACGRGFASLIEGAGNVLTMTRFISHKAEDTAKSRGVNLTRVNGGMSSLRDALTTLYVNG